jgi:cytochrome c556
MKFSLISSTVAASLVAGALFAGGHLAYEQRQAAMKTLGGSMKTLGGMAQGAAPFDAAIVAATLAAMQAAAETAQGAFPAEPDLDPESKALAAIWENRADFDARQLALVDIIVATAANPPADAAAIGPMMQQIGGTCQSCHENYRMPDQ